MTPLRLNQIITEAKAAAKQIKLRECQWAARIEYQGSNKRFTDLPSETQQILRAKPVHSSRLPIVSPAEHQFLTTNCPKVARYTRTAGATGWVDTDPMQFSRPAHVREIWVGARSLGCLASESDVDGFSQSQIEQEDAAELTDLQTTLYADTLGFNAWVRQQLKNVPKKYRLKTWRFLQKAYPHHVMITDPDTGEYRPIRNGDIITVAHGSNEDLDALYMEEPADERSEADASVREITRYQIRANTDLESKFLEDPDYAVPRRYLPEDYQPMIDDLAVRRAAQEVACQYVEEHPEQGGNILSITDLAEKQIRDAMENDPITRSDFFALLERNLRALEQARRKVLRSHCT